MTANCIARALIGRRFLIVVGAVWLSACTATHVVHSWMNPQISPVGKVIVIGVSKEEGIRRLFEDKMSRALVTGGLDAVPSYSVLSKSGEVPQEEVNQAVRKSGADTVVITRLVRIAHRLDTVPVPAPAPMWGAYWGWPSPYWTGYYYDSYRVIEREFAFIETQVMRADNGELLLSVTTRTDDPTYTEQQVQGLVNVLDREFIKAGLVKPAK